MNRRRNLLILAGAIVLIVIVGIIGARPKHTAVEAHVVTVGYGVFQTRLPETGTIQRPTTQTLSALVAGNLETVYVKPGDHVAAGQLLLTISNPQIVNAAQTAHDTYVAASGRASSAVETNTVLPAQNRSAVVQAQAGLEQAKFNLNQARQDVRSGAQSGLGYGGSSAAAQRSAADATLAKAETDAREADRVYTANQDLFNNKAISRDTLETSRARAEQARVSLDQARQERNETYTQLQRQAPVLSDRVRSYEDAVKQAQAALVTAQLTASQSKSGDVQAARSDAAARLSDWQYAQDQVARLAVRAPFSGIVQTIVNQTGDTLRPLQPGDPITVGQAVMTVASDRGYVVRTKVDEQDVASVAVGQPAQISGEDLGTKKLPGHVISVNAVAQKSDDPSNTSRQVVTTIALDQTLPFLRDGMTVDVDIITKNQQHVIAVSSDAVRRDSQNAPYVFVVRDGKAKKVAVTVGVTNETSSVITSGLSAGDKLVNDRNLAVVDGVAVQPLPQPSASPKTTAAR